MIRYFIPVLFSVSGVLSLLAALLNWDWFFKSKNAKMFIHKMSRRNARLFYGLFGIILIATAILSFCTGIEQ